MFRPLLFDVLRLPMPDTFRLPGGVTKETATDYYLESVERLLAAEHDSIAALILEPLVQGAAGMVMHPPGYLRGVRELTRKYNVLLIADEVAVGFGRTGTMFACEQEDVSPDLLCVAKGLTGGYLPMAATLATNQIFQAFLGAYAESKTFYHGHTYGGNPLAAAVALATLDVFEEENTLVAMQPQVELLSKLLAGMLEHPHVGDVRQRGLMGAIELVKDRATDEPYAWEEKIGLRVCEAAREKGVLLRPLGNVLVVMPPLCISAAELEQIFVALRHGMSRVL